MNVVVCAFVFSRNVKCEANHEKRDFLKGAKFFAGKAFHIFIIGTDWASSRFTKRIPSAKAC